jgi:hypothetical protein
VDNTKEIMYAVGTLVRMKHAKNIAGYVKDTDSGMSNNLMLVHFFGEDKPVFTSSYYVEEIKSVDNP